MNVECISEDTQYKLSTSQTLTGGWRGLGRERKCWERVKERGNFYLKLAKTAFFILRIAKQLFSIFPNLVMFLWNSRGRFSRVGEFLDVHLARTSWFLPKIEIIFPTSVCPYFALFFIFPLKGKREGEIWPEVRQNGLSHAKNCKNVSCKIASFVLLLMKFYVEGWRKVKMLTWNWSRRPPPCLKSRKQISHICPNFVLFSWRSWQRIQGRGVFLPKTCQNGLFHAENRKNIPLH